MKKILMGLMAVSAISFAANTVDLVNGEVGPGKNIFLSTQEGAIKVTGTVTSNVPVIKYVIFASNDNGATRLDTLELSNFIINTDTSVAGFENTNSKVYVKRVVGDAGAETTGELEVADDVEFKVTLDPSWDGLVLQPWLASSGTTSMECKPFNLLTKTVLEDVATKVNENLGTTDLRLQDSEGNYGNFTVTNNGSYGGGKNVLFEVTSNGVLEVKTGSDNIVTLSSNYTDAINNQFAGGKAISSTVDIKVRVR